MLPGLGKEMQILIEPGLYTFDSEVLLERLTRVPNGVASVMLVGHNPAMEVLAVRIADRGDRLNALREKYPTAGFAEIAFPAGSWERSAIVRANSCDSSSRVTSRDLA